MRLIAKRARRQYQRDGEIEIDDGAVISRGDPRGAYVAAWVWAEMPKIKKPKKEKCE